MSTEDFDPYEQWLGISRHERPIDFYRLLGLERFEADPQRIVAAANERMTYIRQFQTGPRGLHTQKLLNEFSSAKLKLLNPTTKAEYDERLRHSALAAEEFALAENVELPVAAIAESLEDPADAAPLASAAPALPVSLSPPPPLVPSAAAPAQVQIQAKRRRSTTSATRRRGGRLLPLLITAGVLAAAAYGIYWYQQKQAKLATTQTAPEDPQPAGSTETSLPPLPEGVVIQRASGSVQLDARTAVIHGTNATLVPEGETGVIADWTSGTDYLSWEFQLRKGAVFRIKVTYAAAGEPVTGRWQLRCDDQTKGWDLRDTGSLESFVTDEILMQVQEPGMHRLQLHVSEKPADVIVAVKSVVLEPRRR